MPSVRLLDCALATYNYSVMVFNPVAVATDVWQLAGSNNKAVKVRYFEIGGTAAAGRSQPVGMVRRSTASSGGTNTTPTPRPVDSADGAAAAVITQWTTLPGGLGTLVGLVDGSTFSLMQGTTIQDRAIFNYEQTTAKPPTLNSATDFFCWNFQQGVTPVSTIITDKLDFEVFWTEQ